MGDFLLTVYLIVNMSIFHMEKFPSRDACEQIAKNYNSRLGVLAVCEPTTPPWSMFN